jgi:uncharacterized protein YbjT (DUF2867 family)
MKTVLVAGATGYLGRFLLMELKKHDFITAALARDINKLKNMNSYIDRFVVAEATKPHSLVNICDGVDYVISTIGITRQKDGLTYMDVDYQANYNLLSEALNSDVKKFCYISILNAHLMPDLKIIQAKERFVRHLKLSGINYTVIKPNGFFSDMEEVLNMAERGKVYLFGKGENLGNPIHGADLAEFIVKNIESNEKEIEVGGAELFTQNQIVQLAFIALNKKMRIVYIPVWVRDFLIKLLRLFSSQKTYGPVEFFMTVMTMDMIAPPHGKYRLEDYYKELASAKSIVKPVLRQG